MGQVHPGQGEPSNEESCSGASGCVLLFMTNEFRNRRIRIPGLNIEGSRNQEPEWASERDERAGRELLHPGGD